jgi:hypothetical protein
MVAGQLPIGVLRMYIENFSRCVFLSTSKPPFLTSEFEYKRQVSLMRIFHIEAGRSEL